MKSLKNRFRKADVAVSFKHFVRNLAREGDADAIAWLLHKKASWNTEAKKERLAHKGARIAAEKSATKLARKKKSGSSTTK